MEGCEQQIARPEYGVRWTNIQGFHPLWGNADYFDAAHCITRQPPSKLAPPRAM